MSKFSVQLSSFKRLVYFLLVVGMLKIIDISLAIFGYKRVCRYLVLFSPTPNPNRICFPSAISTSRIVNRAVHRLGGAPCLRRSLLLWWLLRWRRIPTSLVIGVNPAGGHAWVEHHGQVINDRPDVATCYAIVYSERLSPEGISILQ